MAFQIKQIVFDVVFDKQFKNYTRRLTEKEKEKIKERIKIFQNNPFDRRLKTHKLKGKLKEYWVFSICYSD